MPALIAGPLPCLARGMVADAGASDAMAMAAVRIATYLLFTCVLHSDGPRRGPDVQYERSVSAWASVNVRKVFRTSLDGAPRILFRVGVWLSVEAVLQGLRAGDADLVG